MNADSRPTRRQVLRRCQHCGGLLRGREGSRRFCSQACLDAYRLAHADRSTPARAQRRRRLAQAFANGELTEAEYRARLQSYLEHDLL